MVASRKVLHRKREALGRARLGCGDDRTAVQLAGCDAECMAEAARIVAGQGARIIDINLGCPSKKVTGGWSGSALMRDPDHALRLVDGVVHAVDMPVTLKMRLGWDETSINAPEIAMRAEAAGVRMITVHGRTRCQFYRGEVDWSAIARVRAAVSVPVVANGDIAYRETAEEALRRSRATGLMIGRAARGQPWILSRIAAALAGRAAPPASIGGALLDLLLQHYDAMLSFYGVNLGVRVARKHLGWYLDRIPGATDLRRQVLVATLPEAVVRALTAGFGDLPSARIAA